MTVVKVNNLKLIGLMRKATTVKTERRNDDSPVFACLSTKI